MKVYSVPNYRNAPNYQNTHKQKSQSFNGINLTKSGQSVVDTMLSTLRTDPIEEDFRMANILADTVEKLKAHATEGEIDITKEKDFYAMAYSKIFDGKKVAEHVGWSDFDKDLKPTVAIRLFLEDVLALAGNTERNNRFNMPQKTTILVKSA